MDTCYEARKSCAYNWRRTARERGAPLVVQRRLGIQPATALVGRPLTSKWAFLEHAQAAQSAVLPSPMARRRPSAPECKISVRSELGLSFRARGRGHGETARRGGHPPGDRHAGAEAGRAAKEPAASASHSPHETRSSGPEYRAIQTEHRVVQTEYRVAVTTRSTPCPPTGPSEQAHACPNPC